MKVTLSQDDGVERELLKGNTHGALGSARKLLDAAHLQLTAQSVYSKDVKGLICDGVRLAVWSEKQIPAALKSSECLSDLISKV